MDRMIEIWEGKLAKPSPQLSLIVKLDHIVVTQF
jgi:hypothetical protein